LRKARCSFAGLFFFRYHFCFGKFGTINNTMCWFYGDNLHRRKNNALRNYHSFAAGHRLYGGNGIRTGIEWKFLRSDEGCKWPARELLIPDDGAMPRSREIGSGHLREESEQDVIENKNLDFLMSPALLRRAFFCPVTLIDRCANNIGPQKSE
jgi:hypothetical protein